MGRGRIRGFHARRHGRRLAFVQGKQLGGVAAERRGDRHACQWVRRLSPSGDASERPAVDASFLRDAIQRPPCGPRFGESQGELTVDRHAAIVESAALFAIFNGVDYFVWAARECARSPRFRREVDVLRRLARGADRGEYARTTGPLGDRGWEELEELLDQQRRQDQAARAHAWKNTDKPTDDPLRHVGDYLRRCRRVARGFLGHEDAAPAIHRVVVALERPVEALVAELAADASGALAPGEYIPIRPPAPQGPVASALAAHIIGVSFGAGATAMRQAWYRHRPRGDGFVFVRDLDDR